MAHKKNSFKDVSRKEIKELKALGLIDYDLRKSLTTGQKSTIAKLAGKHGQYRQVLNNPDDYHIQKAPKGTKSGLKTAGFKVTRGGIAVIPKYEYNKVTLTKGRVTLQSGSKREDIYLAGSRQFFDKLKNLNDTKAKLARNQMLTVQIGDNNTFSSRFSSYWHLYQYLTKFQPKDEGVSRESIFARMSIVTITEPGTAKAKSPGAKRGKKGK